MKLSTRVRYGLRALLEIGLHGNMHPVDLNEISKNQHVSKKYLHALLVQLKNAGILSSVRGNTGGYLLSRKPEEISLLDVYVALEGSVDLVDCVINDQLCDRAKKCVTRKLWDRLGSVIRRELEATSLADLIHEYRSIDGDCYEI